jgi:glucosamine-6-phosphate deaminase
MPRSAHSVGRLEVHVLAPEAAARELAAEIGALVRERASEGRPCVLGFATGRTPLGVYAELVRMHREEGLSFDGVVAVNLDEYEGVEPKDPRSFAAWMRAQLFDAVGLPPERTLIPPPDLAVAAEVAWCRAFEERLRGLGGVDLQILGLGRNGHIAFNEPGSSRESRTRRVRLAAETRADAAAAWDGLDQVPTHAITQGVATILEARRLRALAFGEGKREIVRRTLEESIGPRVPATFLREHADARLYVDEPALGRS